MAAYDVIIVGAGSAGARLAAGLSGDATTSVLLLEAGPVHGTAASRPRRVRSTNFFRAVMEPGRIWPDLVATRAAGQPEALYVRGRGAGGSSSVNAMCRDPRHRRRLRALGGRLRLPRAGDGRRCSKRSCGSRTISTTEATDYHGDGGPDSAVSRVPFDELSPLDVRFADGDARPRIPDVRRLPRAGRHRHQPRRAHRARRPACLDERRVPRAGASTCATSTYGVTCSSTGCCSTGRRAIGVRTAAGEEISGDEVIVSAGAIHSPAILLRSGVGIDDGLAGGREPEGPCRDSGL